MTSYSSGNFQDLMAESAEGNDRAADSKSTFQSYVKQFDIPVVINDIAHDVGVMKTDFERKWFGTTGERMKERRKAFQNVIADLNRSVLKPSGWTIKPLNRPKGDNILVEDWVYEATAHITPEEIPPSEEEKDKSRPLERARDSFGNILPIHRADITFEEAQDIMHFELGSGGNPDICVTEITKYYSLEEIAEAVLNRMQKEEAPDATF
jgi:hypothetical protein